MKILFVLFTFLMSTTWAKSFCDQELKLSNDQKTALGRITQETEAEVKVLNFELVEAKKNLKSVLLKSGSSKEKARRATAQLNKKSQNIKDILEKKKLQVLFDVLTPKQRVEKLKCETKPRSHFGRSGVILRVRRA